MNSGQPYMDVNQGHPPSAPPPSGYSYGQPQPLQPGAQQYQTTSYGGYQPGYSMPPMAPGHPVTSAMNQGMVGHPVTLPTMAPGAPPAQGPGYGQSQGTFDTTGQVAPAGMKPRVTATLWEDEGSLCFQVEASGVCVARREDNHMINGTKLLNVAGMTRGRRDGILKSEKTRHVVKIGPMHLKGVWIPFDRALDFANKEKITELLYPLFVHNIGALLYHPSNANRASIGNGAMASRRSDSTPQEYIRTPTGTQPPPPPLQHHHTMNTPAGSQPSHAIAPHPAAGRPGLDRAHTFPTPPASTTSMMGMGNSGSSYEYSGTPGTAMHPSTTPPSVSQTMPYANSQSYDQSRNVYSTPTYSQYPSSQQYAHPASVKSEIGGQARAGAEQDHVESKTTDGYVHHGEGEVDGNYAHNRAVHHEATHLPPDMANSPQQNGSGRATPRTTTTYTGYATPQRTAQLPSSNLYNVISNDGRSQNGSEYHAQGYQTHYPSMNGLPSSNKRVREVDDSEDQFGRPTSSPGGGLKRQRTDGPIAGRPISQPHSVKPVR